ncbi:hypothetical protein D3C76_51730 [compost metagenome]
MKSKEGESIGFQPILESAISDGNNISTAKRIAVAAKELHEELIKCFPITLADELLIAAIPSVCAEMSMRSRALFIPKPYNAAIFKKSIGKPFE